LPVGPLAAVGQLGARRFELHEHVVGGVMEELTLLGQNEPARMTVKQRHAELLFERRHLPRHRRLRQAELLAGMREAAGLGGGVENLELVPVHGPLRTRQGLHSAAMARSASPCTPRKRSASNAPMQPYP